MASNLKAGESLAIDSLLPNLKSRGPSLVQVKGFRATIMTIQTNTQKICSKCSIRMILLPWN